MESFHDQSWKGKTHDELPLFLCDDLFVPPRPLAESFHFGAHVGELVAIRLGALIGGVELVAEGEEALRVLRLELVRVGEFGAGGGEFGLEPGDERGADGSLLRRVAAIARRGMEPVSRVE